MNVIAAFLVAFLTLNISVLTGIGVATFDQPIKPIRTLIQRGVLLTAFTFVLGSVIQIEILLPILPLLALASVYGMQFIEKRFAPDQVEEVTTLTIMTQGGALTAFAILASATSPVQLEFYATAAGIVVTYLVTISLLQLLQRRLKLAQVPTVMKNIPLLALTLAILAMIFGGFTAIF
ncbi:MAG: hypothetical protein ACRC5Q_03230 [Culicoidibacterales bacterium]